MPRRRQTVDAQIQIELELECLERWKTKTKGVSSYEWDGVELVLQTQRGREVFDRDTVEAVIFANFRPDAVIA